LNAPVKIFQNGSQNNYFAHYTLCNAITIKNAKNGLNSASCTAKYEFEFVFGVLIIPA